MLKRTPKKATVRRRPNTGHWRGPFLASLRNSGNVRASCEAAGVARSRVYKSRDEDEEFRAAWAEAEREAVELLEAEARRRAMKGSDVLLIFLLKAHDPKYRFAENVHVTGELTWTALVARAREVIDVEFEDVSEARPPTPALGPGGKRR